MTDKAQKIQMAANQYPDAVHILRRFTEGKANGSEGNTFLADVAARFFKYGTLTPKQADAIIKARRRDLDKLKDKALWDAKKKVAPTGKADVDVTVIKAYVKNTKYGRRYVMLVEGDGFRAWGAVPKEFADLDIPAGMKLGFTAEFTRSDDDDSFAFFKKSANAYAIDLNGAA